MGEPTMTTNINPDLDALEQLPPDGQVVYVPGGVAYRRDGAWYSLTGYGWPGALIDWPVTWWLPLDALPDLIAAARERDEWEKHHFEKRITTRCPACGHQTLFIAYGGHLTCSWAKCPEPSPEAAFKAERQRAEQAEQREARLREALTAAEARCPCCADTDRCTYPDDTADYCDDCARSYGPHAGCRCDDAR